MNGKKTLLGLAAILVPYLDYIYQSAAGLPEGVLPAKVKVVLGGLGWLLALYGRAVAKGPLVEPNK